MRSPITNDVFDTRDLIEYIEYLESEVVSEYNELLNERAVKQEEDDYDEIDSINDADDESILENCYTYNELNKVLEFADEVKSYCSDYEYGETLIHEDYFVEYCTDFVEDCGYIPRDLPSWIEIDFEATAENMKQDYTEADYEGSTYYFRSC